MTVKFISVPTKRLAETINGSAYAFELNNIQGWDGSNLEASDFGTKHYISFRNTAGTKLELMEIDPATIASSQITILKRGLGFDGDQVTEVAANIQDVWVKGDTLVELGTHASQLLEETVRKSGDQTIQGLKTFGTLPQSSATPSDPKDFATKTYADNLSYTGAPDGSTTVKGVSRLSSSPDTTLGTATITIATPGVVTLNSHGLTVNDSIKFTTTGTLPTGITAGTMYYVISSGLTTNTFQISGSLGGSAINTSGSQSGTHTLVKNTPVSVGVNDTRLPTQSENDALAGTGTPSGSNKFVTADTLASTVVSGMVSPYAGFTAPSGWLLADGSAVSRSTYSTLFSLLNPTVGTATMTIAAPGVITCTGHGLASYDAVYFTTTGALPTGISANTVYYVYYIDANTFNLCTSIANVTSATKITTSGSQSGVHTLSRSPYGIGDGSTTFNVPNLKGKIPVGTDVTDTDFKAPGHTGGEKTHQLTLAEMASHYHTTTFYTGGGAVNYLLSGPTNAQNGTTTINTDSKGGDTPHNNIQPYISMNYIIKY